MAVGKAGLKPRNAKKGIVRKERIAKALNSNEERFAQGAEAGARSESSVQF